MLYEKEKIMDKLPNKNGNGNGNGKKPYERFVLVAEKVERTV